MKTLCEAWGRGARGARFRVAAILGALVLAGCLDTPPQQPAASLSQPARPHPARLDGEGYVDFPAGTGWAAAHLLVPASAWTQDENGASLTVEVQSEDASAKAAACFLFLVGEGGRLELVSALPKLADWGFSSWTPADPEDEEWVLLFVVEGLEAPARLWVAAAAPAPRNASQEDFAAARGDRAALSLYTESQRTDAGEPFSYGVKVRDTRGALPIPASPLVGPGTLTLDTSRSVGAEGFHATYFATGAASPRAGAGRYMRSVDGAQDSQSRMFVPLQGAMVGTWYAMGREVEETLELRTDVPEDAPTVALLSASTTWNPTLHGLAPGGALVVRGGVGPVPPAEWPAIHRHLTLDAPTF